MAHILFSNWIRELWYEEQFVFLEFVFLSICQTLPWDTPAGPAGFVLHLLA